MEWFNSQGYKQCARALALSGAATLERASKMNFNLGFTGTNTIPIFFKTIGMDLNSTLQKCFEAKLSADVAFNIAQDMLEFNYFDVYAFGLNYHITVMLASERYESEDNSGYKMCIFPGTENFGFEGRKKINEFCCPFCKENHLDYSIQNVHGIRKFLNMSTKESSLLLICDSLCPLSYKVYGLIDEKNALDLNLPMIAFNAHTEWDLKLPVINNDSKQYDTLLSCKSGTLLLNDLVVHKEFIFSDLEDYFKNNQQKNMEKVRNCINLLFDHRRGAILIIGDKSHLCKQAKRLKECRRALVIENCNFLVQPSSILSISAVDGAIFLDLNGDYVAHGVILDGSSNCPGDISRGSRYNSTKNFIYSLPTAESNAYVGIVISEDGMIDFISIT